MKSPLFPWILSVATTFFTLAGPAAAQDYAVSLNGLDAYGSAAGTDVVANSTWEAWLRVPAYDPSLVPGARGVLCRWGMWTHTAPNIDPTDGSAFGAGGYSCNAPYAPPGTISTQVWHHVATVFGPETSPSWSLFVDGNLINSEGPGCHDPYAGWEIVLGATGYIGYSGFLKAEIDEARISSVPRYSGAFVPETAFAPDAATVALWHFDEGVGTTAVDASGNGHDFTLHGGFAWVSGCDLPTCCASGSTIYCTAKVNSQACVPAVSHTGNASLSGPDDFHITASQILNNKTGMFLWSLQPNALPFYGGTLCIRQPIQRTNHQQSGGNPSLDDCSGSFDFHFSQAYMAQAQLSANQRIYAQYWYRDPGYPIGYNVGLTAGLMFSICP